MFISRRIMSPVVGKTELAHERAKRAAGIIGRHSNGTRLLKVIAGEGAGDLHLYSMFDSMAHAGRASMGIAGDSDMQALQAEREADPAGVVSGPEVFRMLMGTPDASNKASMQRIYEISRSNIPAAMGLMAELQEMMKEEPITLIAGVPVVAAKMDVLTVSYGFKDLEALGEGIDRIGLSDEFQELVNRASDLGRLFEARGLIDIG
jgi:hypothetical protein